MSYRFERLDVAAANKITAKLNEWSAEGWRVVSHTEAGGEYSFVLAKINWGS